MPNLPSGISGVGGGLNVVVVVLWSSILSVDADILTPLWLLVSPLPV